MVEAVELGGGKTSYEFCRKNSGGLVVFVHGLSIPMWAWDKQFDFFSEEFSVLRYDMYGKGGSQKGYGRYDRELYISQLSDILDSLAGREPVFLVGHSFGGAVSAAFTLKYPEKVKKLILVNPFVSLPLKYKILVKSLQIPWLGKFVFDNYIMGIIEKRAKSFFELTGCESEHYKKLFFQDIEGLKGNLYSLLSGDALKSYAGIYEKLSKLDVEVFLIHGGKDSEVSSEQVRKITSKVQGVKVTIMEGSGHAPTIEETDRFNRVLMEYLKN